MIKRVVTGTIFVIVLVVIVMLNIPIVDTISIFILSIMGIYEYNKAFKNKGYNPVSIISYASCLPILLIGNFIDYEYKLVILRMCIPTILIATFVYIIVTGLKHSIIDVAITVMSALYIPFLFSFLKLIVSMDNGRLLIWYVFLGAFACDTFAYLVGSKFGKKKLCPSISPKKTVEGSIAGIIGTVISYILITYIGNVYFAFNFNIIYMIIAGIFVSIASQFGDFSASIIKRHCEIKDFSDLMPGHGGILDRFDSVLFVAPVVYMFLKIYMFM